MRLAARLALIALIIGTATSAAAAGRITLSLVVSGALIWSFVPLLQLCTGLLLVRGASIPRGRALELYFDTHHAWSLWLLILAVLILLAPNPVEWLVDLIATGIVPLALTARALTSLGRNQLGFTPAIARRRVVVHQTATLVLVLLYGEYAGGILRRAIDVITDLPG